MLKSITVVFAFLICSSLNAQDTLLVFLKDKKGGKSIHLSDKSRIRRMKNKSNYDSRDIEVSEVYLNELNKSGAILSTSRWLNSVHFVSDIPVDELSANYNFIESVTLINKANFPNVIRKNELIPESYKVLNYGVADSQIYQLNLDCLHDLGYNGDSVLVGIIDAGFMGMDTISYFDSLFLENRVIETYNFIAENAFVYDYSNHGTAVSSCIFAEKSGAEPYIGTAVDSKVVLYLTEDVNSETLIEEYNLVRALERCDTVGVDIVNISLGYIDFDNPAENHTYQDMNGNTTIAAIGVNAATSKGILVLAAAGNGGPSTIGTPCDADSCLCVGGVDAQGNYAFFSSVGPSSDGQVKPDVVARAFGAWVVMEDGQLVQANGTSFATPIMTGAAACLLQSRPNSTVEELKSAIRSSANHVNSPDEFTGYGIPDFCYAQSIIGVGEIKPGNILVFPNPTQNLVTISSENVIQHISWYTTTGQEVNPLLIGNDNGAFTFDFSSLSKGIYYLTIEEESAWFNHRVTVGI